MTGIVNTIPINETCKRNAQLDFPKHVSLRDGASKFAVKKRADVVTPKAKLLVFGK